MSAHTLAVIAIRILAVYFIIEGITSLSSQYELLIHWRSLVTAARPEPLVVLSLSTVPLLCGVVLWALAWPLGRFAISGATEKVEGAPGLEPVGMLSVLIIFMGLYLIAVSVPPLIWLMVQAVIKVATYEPSLTGAEGRSLVASDSSWMFNAFHHGAQLLLGIIFVLQRAGIRRLVQTVEYPGRDSR